MLRSWEACQFSTLKDSHESVLGGSDVEFLVVKRLTGFVFRGKLASLLWFWSGDWKGSGVQLEALDHFRVCLRRDDGMEWMSVGAVKKAGTVQGRGQDNECEMALLIRS